MAINLPVLPHGSPSILSGLSETFAFHTSPENFITSRILDFHSKHPDLAQSRIPIRARVLNRNIAVISSHDHVKQILCDSAIVEKLSSSLAYDELMAPFFPPRNLLLTDPPHHGDWKAQWIGRMENIMPNVVASVPDIVRRHFQNPKTGQTEDLYDNMKDLSWRLLTNAFLTTSGFSAKDESLISKIIELQEDLLRGQFSLFPVSLNLGMWSSPRSRGLNARKKLQSLLKEYLGRPNSNGPFNPSGAEEIEDVANHLLLFTSSLAAKALASLLTALVLNLYTDHSRKGDGNSIGHIRNSSDEAGRLSLIEKLVRQTERNSPPVVGIMRRTTGDIILQPSQFDQTATLIPKGWDIWLYFVGAAHDHVPPGSYANDTPDRKYSDRKVTDEESFAFGAGPKTCLGQNLIRQMVVTVVKSMIGVKDDGSMTPLLPINLEDCVCANLPEGVQAWLGSRTDVTPEAWARDMKQLPVQRPAKPILVRFVIDKPKPYSNT